MVSAALAFVGALVYGSADFLGGLAARRLRAVVVTAVAALSGAALLVALWPVFGGSPTASDLMWGALSGITGAAAVALLYGCLAIGPMSILSPVTAVVSAIAPMIWGVAAGDERVGTLGIVGLGLAPVAIVLVALLPGETVVRPSARGLAMAVGSGLAIGAFLIILDQIGDGAGILPLVLGRSVNAAIMLTVVSVLIVGALRSGLTGRAAWASAVRSRAAEPGPETLRTAWLLAATCGVADALANLLLLLALRAGGDLAIVAALTALYPAGTVLLAAVVLRERIARVQWLGLALGLTAGVLLAIS